MEKEKQAASSLEVELSDDLDSNLSTLKKLMEELEQFASDMKYQDPRFC